ncbi:MAG: HD domain-containing protein [Acidobacteriia bacterium]|nr:HD domain-containing protein [Terriglobia bacterium]
MPDSHKHKKRVLSRPLSDKFNDALVYAARLHREQPRKGKDIPYVGHLLGVASLVLESGGDEEMAIAALLHDAVEDQGGQPRLEEIRKLFGAKVARIVDGCTDSYEVDPDKKASWCERKQKYIAHVERAADPEVRLVSIADKVHNARAVLADHYEIGDEVFNRFSKGKQGTLWYYRALADAFRAAEARDRHPDDDAAQGRRRMMDKLERVVDELERRSGGRGVNPCRG